MAQLQLKMTIHRVRRQFVFFVKTHDKDPLNKTKFDGDGCFQILFAVDKPQESTINMVHIPHAVYFMPSEAIQNQGAVIFC